MAVIKRVLKVFNNYFFTYIILLILLFYNYFIYSLLLMLYNGFVKSLFTYIVISFPLITADFLKAIII